MTIQGNMTKTEGKLIAASQVIVLLFAALEMLEDCKDCEGSGVIWWNLGPGELTPVACECTTNAVSVMETHKQSYIDAQILLERLAI